MSCADFGQSAKTGSSKEPPDIRTRSFKYALRAIALYQYLQKQRDGAGWIIGKQYLKAATSIGANIEEAQGSESLADFIHEVGIAQKEARESLFWLRLLADSHIVPLARLDSLMRENEELIAIIITAIVVNAKRKREG